MKGMSFLFDNLLYKGVALFVAVILWAATQGFRSVEQSLNVPITLENYDRDSLVVVEQSSQEVNLRIVGSQAAVRRAEQQLRRYPVSLGRVQPGELRMGVDPEQLPLPRGARVSAWSPSNLVFRIEPVERRRVPVRPDTAGRPAEGYRVTSIEVEPRELGLAGARSSITRIRDVSTERVDLSGLRETASYPVQVVLGRPHVWRDDQSSTLVTVVVRVERIADSPRPPDQEAPGPPDA